MAYHKHGYHFDDVLLYSGGMDSYIAYHYLKAQGKNPACLYVDLGHRYSMREQGALTQTSMRMPGAKFFVEHSVNLGNFEAPDAFIPLRNSFLAHVGSLYADNVHLVVQKGEMNIPDRSEAFFKSTSEYLTQLHGKPITVSTPFSTMTKVDMVKWYIEAGLPLQGLLDTTSCYSGFVYPCGKCGACFRRWVALSLNGIEEYYTEDPWDTDLAKSYLEKGQAGFYGSGRDEEILEALARKGVK